MPGPYRTRIEEVPEVVLDLNDIRYACRRYVEDELGLEVDTSKSMLITDQVNKDVYNPKMSIKIKGRKSQEEDERNHPGREE